MSARAGSGQGGWVQLWGAAGALVLAVALAGADGFTPARMGFAPLAGLLGAVLLGVVSFRDHPQAAWVRAAILAGVALCLGAAAITVLPFAARDPVFVLVAVGLWLAAWMLVARLAQGGLGRVSVLGPPAVFGLTLIWAWEGAVRALEVPRVILPPPSAIAARIATSTDILWTDVVQTVFKGALSGFAIGCGAAILFALVVDRFDFLRRGLLPVGNFLAALPIIGTAPIMVMWFGFDWPSKAAVVVAMVFFPMLVNTVQGLAATDTMQRDLMRTWSASWWQALWGLRLPAAMPFIFNGLKICATLALIGAIVAEFFGSPTRGMGFRISTEVGRLQLDMVWAEIAVAALAGSAFYGIWALLERRVTFWHPSQRSR
jgi:NitT/TauT family transport system permease protein